MKPITETTAFQACEEITPRLLEFRHGGYYVQAPDDVQTLIDQCNLLLVALHDAQQAIAALEEVKASLIRQRDAATADALQARVWARLWKRIAKRYARSPLNRWALGGKNDETD